jgi:glycosyltransferase involved in cell wall biosynthesis
MAALRCLTISGEYPPMQGGVADYTHILGQHLERLGADIHVLTSLDAAAPPCDDAHVHPNIESWGWRELYGAVRRLLRQLEPDVISIQYQAAAYRLHPAINVLPLRFRDTPIVTTFHDLRVPYLFPKAGPLRQEAVWLLARHSKAVITTNGADRAVLAARRGMPAIHEIPIGSNVAKRLPEAFDRAQWRAAWGLPSSGMVLCYFGFLNPTKGGEDLMRCLASLVRRGVDAHLVMIGGTIGASDPANEAYLASVLALVSHLGLQARVHWTDYLPDTEVSAAFALSDLCVLPYRDGASLRRGSLMAAMAHGMPILSTEPESPVRELDDGGNIRLVPRGSPTALAEAAWELWQDPPTLRRLAEGAKELSVRFRWEGIAKRTLEVLHAAAESD